MNIRRADLAQRHQFVDRSSGLVLDERLYHDRIVRFLYSTARERAPWMLKAATSRWSSALLGYLNFDARLSARLLGNRRFLAKAGVCLEECVAPPEWFTTPRRIFERQIRYETHRPMPERPDAVVSPADARVTVGSLRDGALLSIKGKFFDAPTLLARPRWARVFANGDVAVFRLTPEQYHYNHTPVAGRVRDFYEVPGAYHACNPTAAVEIATPLSMNRRVVTVIDTDVEGGTGVGCVAMVEVVALMIGGIEQRYSRRGYADPQPIVPGMFVERGVPKSLYRPGSSTDVLLFEPNRIRFAEDLEINARRAIASRYRLAFHAPLVETELRVRSLIATPQPPEDRS